MNQTQIKPYIFYHSHCQDGILATGVMLNFFESSDRYLQPHITAYNHGDPIDVKTLKISRGYNRRNPHDETKLKWTSIEVYFLDILPSYDILKCVADTGCKIYILDHHKSAIKIIKDILTTPRTIIASEVDESTGEIIEKYIEIPKYQNITSYFNLNYSGCGLAWKFASENYIPSEFSYECFRGFKQNIPQKYPEYNPLVEFVQDRDIWRHSYKESNWVLSYLATTKRAVNHASYAKELSLWGDTSGTLHPIESVDGSRTLYVNDFALGCIEKGRKVFIEYQEECERIASNHVIKTLHHPNRVYKVAITECPGKYASAVGDILANLPGVDFSVSYESVTEYNGGNSQCRGIIMNLDNKDPYIYLRARARTGISGVDLSEIIRFWDADGSTGGGHEKAAGSTSTLGKFTTSFV